MSLLTFPLVRIRLEACRCNPKSSPCPPWILQNLVHGRSARWIEIRHPRYHSLCVRVQIPIILLIPLFKVLTWALIRHHLRELPQQTDPFLVIDMS